MLRTQDRTAYEEEHELFRDQVRKFFERALIPNLARWEEEGIVDRDFWRACGEAGLLCPTIPAEYGGLGLDFRFNAIIDEEIAYAGSSAGLVLRADIVEDYILHYGSEDQRRSEEHTSELQSLMRISYAVFCLKKKITNQIHVTCLLATE